MKSIVAAVVLVRARLSGELGAVARRLQAFFAEYSRGEIPLRVSGQAATFRVVAPDAQKVRIRIGPGFDMQKGPDGIWDVTTTPLVEGFHYYTVQIDGAVVADPSTMTFFGSGWWNSGIEIPASEGDFYAAKDVPARPREPAALLLNGDATSGGALTFTRPPTTTARPATAIPVLTCCTAGAKTKPVGTGRATSI